MDCRTESQSGKNGSRDGRQSREDEDLPGEH
jgi:hypothetical protein